MAYIPTNWEDLPSTDTPINAERLNNMETGISYAHTQLDGRLSVANLEAAIKDSRGTVVDSDYASLEAALLDVPSGGTLEVRETWTRTTAFVIDKPCTVVFDGAGFIDITSANTHGIRITSSNVTVVNPNLRGNTATVAGTSCGIIAEGTAASPLDRVEILGTRSRARITRWSLDGIYFSNVTNFVIHGLRVDTIAYGAIQVLAGLGGEITENYISNVLQTTGFPDSYGIAMTRNSSVSLAVSPRSERILCARNVIVDVPNWEGIDTHGGDKLVVIDNQIYGCLVGIALVPCPNQSGEDIWAPTNIICTGNTIDSRRSNGTARAGITLVGAISSTNVVSQYASAVIANNTIIDHGIENTSSGGGIVAYVSQGAVIQGNRIVRPGLSGVNLYHSNLDAIVAGNVVEDVWANAGFTAAVYVRSTSNTAVVSDTQIARGGKVAGVINQRGLYVGATAGNRIVDGGGNRWDVCSIPVSAPANGVIRIMNGELAGANVFALPTLGVWQRGAQVISTAVSAGGSPGWFVTVSGGASSALWAATTAYTQGAWIRTASGKVLECMVAGTSASSEPNPVAVGDSVTDGTVTWVCRSLTSATFKPMAAVGA